ncbi:MAG: hypothetical protein JG777_861 [Clostridia bacterium]|jgi:glycosyltransferase involved in cell wall biosynthesis|nr:hypothetical protein [Clostridia bacterium]
MKILYLVHQFYPEFYTGTEKFVLNLATAIKKMGNEVKVLTYSFYEDSFYDKSIGDVLIREFEYNGISIIALKNKNESKVLHYTLEDNSLESVAHYFLKGEKPDVIHIAHPRRVSSFINVCNRLNIPYVVTLTDFFFICQKIILMTTGGNLCLGPDKGKKCVEHCSDYKLISNNERFITAEKILLNAKKVFAPSKFVANIFRNEIKSLEIKIISHGIDISNLKQNQKKYKKGDKIVFGFTGSFNYHKGLHLIISAFQQIKLDNIELKIYGSGVENKYVKDILDEVKKDKRIELCGVYLKEEIGDILKKIDVLIIPSLWYETYCFVLHEAFACSIPVIASNIGILREKIDESNTGFIFEMGNVSMLKEIMENIVYYPEILNEIKQNISKIQMPTIEVEAYEYLKEYNCII